MSAYVTSAQIYAKLPQPKVNDALDDDGDGQADQGALDQVIANAGSAVDGKLGGRYPTPFQPPYPAIVVQAALIFALEDICGRREAAGEKNPFASQARELREQLTKIAARQLPLDATMPEDLQAATGGNTYISGRLGTPPI